MNPHSERRKRHRRTLFKQQGEKCFYCAHDCYLPGEAKIPGRRMATLDHMTPRSQGGGDGLSNLVMACRPCNVNRKDIAFHTFWEEELWKDSKRPRRQELVMVLENARRVARHRTLQPPSSPMNLAGVLRGIMEGIQRTIDFMHKPTLIRTLKTIHDDPLLPYDQRHRLALRIVQNLRKRDEGLDSDKLMRAAGFSDSLIAQSRPV